MVNRELTLIESESGNYAEFYKYVQGKPQKVKRLLNHKEVLKAKAVIESGNKYDIDNFCYSIA